MYKSYHHRLRTICRWCFEQGPNIPGSSCRQPRRLLRLLWPSHARCHGLENYKQLSGEKVYEYMHAYATKFNILERRRFQTTVSSVSRNKDGKAWDVKIANSKEVLTCNKLIISTGLHSNPRWPDVPTMGFSGLIVHSKDVGIQHDKLDSDTIKRVTVYGGCKSAVQAVDMCVNMGKKVDWVIRENGTRVLKLIESEHLEGFRADTHASLPFQRSITEFTPSIFKTYGRCHRLLYSGKHRLGNWYTAQFLDGLVCF